MNTKLGIRAGRAASSVLFCAVAGCALAMALASGCEGEGSTGATGGGSTSSATTTTTTTTTTTGGPSCTTPKDCPDPGNECVLSVCFDGACGTQNAPFGTPLKTQTEGDCQTAVCDGAGATTSVNDNSDVADDGKQCTVDTCKAGAPAHAPAIAGTLCGENNGHVCDPSGTCVGCNSDIDCAAGKRCASNNCVAASCLDQVKNNDETDVDCGGSCNGCVTGKTCATGSDCADGVCGLPQHTCQAATCSDGVKNGSETGQDCGNAAMSGCPACPAGQGCATGSDCQSGVCTTATHSCAAPACNDSAKNGSETDVDCGGGCPGCAVGKVCSVNADCASGLCVSGLCAQTTPIITPISAAGHDRAFGLTLDAQGNIYTTGVVAAGTDSTSDFSTVVTKFSPQGVLDTTFGTGGFSIHNITVGTNGELSRGIVLQSTGKIVVSATVDHVGGTDARDRDVAVMRLNPDGSLDTTFGTNGITIVDLSPGQLVGTSFLADSTWGLVVLPDDRLVASCGMVRPGGTDTDYAMVRFTANGVVDTTFGANGVLDVDYNMLNATGVRQVSLLADGSLLGSGYLAVNGNNQPFVYKSKPNGALDTTFGTGGIFTQAIPGLAAQAESYMATPQGNKFVTVGYGRNDAATESLDWISLRLLPNGVLDTTYGNNGVARLDIGGFGDNARYVQVLPDNRVVLSGGGRLSANDVDGAVGILTPNGQPDTTFTPSGVKMIDLGGVNDFLWAVAVGPSKKYLVLAGIKGVATATPVVGNDDSALVLVPLP